MDRRPSSRPLAAIAAPIVVVAAGVLAWSVGTTASGRVSASTDNRSSLFTSAVVDLEVATGQATQLLFDVDGLYPGRVETSCVEVTYTGSLDADVRLHGRATGGTGLDDYLATTIELGRMATGDCESFVADEALFDERLSGLTARHGSYEQGIRLAAAMTPGEQLALRASVSVLDDDAAQGLGSEFWVIVEARP
ncbi:MAG: hypothetical protein R2710_14500 [Acidimicrobiales bacterium]